MKHLHRRIIDPPRNNADDDTTLTMMLRRRYAPTRKDVENLADVVHKVTDV